VDDIGSVILEISEREEDDVSWDDPDLLISEFSANSLSEARRESEGSL
jgi:hypothetical protein